MIRSLLVLTFALLLAAPAHAAPDPSIKDGSAQEALDAARERWAERGFDDYGFRVRRMCFCPVVYTKGYDVEVRDGRPITRHKYVRGHNSVPKLLRIVQEAIDKKVEVLDVKYRPRGFPRRIYIDESSMIADEEVGYTARRMHERGARATAAAGEQAALDAAKARWAERGLTSYDWTVRRACFCPPPNGPFRVHVRDGEAVDPAQQIASHATVAELFDLIQQAIDQNAYRLDVTYADGVPVSVAIDYQENMADDEYGVIATDPREAHYNPAEQAELDAARAQWESEKLANYGYRVRAFCFCADEFTRAYDVHVREGRPVRTHRYIRRWDTVEELFDHIQRAMDGGAYVVSASYGPRGVPQNIAINHSFYIFDEELGLSIRRLREEDAAIPPKVALSILDGTARRNLRVARLLWRDAGRPQRRLAARRFARIAAAIRDRARKLEVRYRANGVPKRVVIRA